MLTGIWVAMLMLRAVMGAPEAPVHTSAAGDHEPVIIILD